MQVFDQRSTRLRRTSQVHGPVLILHNDGAARAQTGGGGRRTPGGRVAAGRQRRPKMKESDGKRRSCRASWGCRHSKKGIKVQIWIDAVCVGKKKKKRKRFLQLGGKAKYLHRRASVCRWTTVFVLFVLPGSHFEAKVLGRDDQRGS